MTATGTSSPLRSRLVAAGVLATLAAAAVVVVLAGGSGSPSRTTSIGSSVPAGWRTVTTSSGQATLAYPPGWFAGHSDPGTVTAYLHLSAADVPRGYLNVTPRQSTESLAGWVGFRLAHNREDGDAAVRLLSSTRMRIGAASATCLSDTYVAKVGTRHWRELACFVQGRRAGSVFVGAAKPADWPVLGPAIERSLATLAQR